MTKKMVVAGASILLLCGAGVQAQNTEYLREMPSAARVIQEVTGRDEVDEVAREIAALSILRRIGLSRMQGRQYNNVYTREEQAFYDGYLNDAVNTATYGRIKDRFDPDCRGSLCPREAYVRLVNDYIADAKFERELRKRYFSRAWLAAERSEETVSKGRVVVPTSPAVSRASRATTRRVIGGILIALAIAAFAYVRYREFKSTNPLGTREYSGFLAMVGSNFLELVLGVIAMAGLLYGGWLLVNG